MTSLEGGIVSLTLENELLCAGCATDASETAASRSDEEGPAVSGDNGARAPGCAACSAFAGDAQRTIDAVNPARLPLEVGDRVVVYLDPKKTVAAALLLFVLPVAAFLFGYAAVLGLLPAAGEEARLLGGAAGFVLSFLYVFVRRAVRKRKDWPVVVEKC